MYSCHKLAVSTHTLCLPNILEELRCRAIQTSKLLAGLSWRLGLVALESYRALFVRQRHCRKHIHTVYTYIDKPAHLWAISDDSLDRGSFYKELSPSRQIVVGRRHRNLSTAAVFDGVYLCENLLYLALPTQARLYDRRTTTSSD